MDFFLSRYRNLTVLLVVIVAQLLLIAYQVKSNKDVALIRIWAVTAVTPVETGLEFVRRYTWGFVEDYFVLLGVRSQNEKLQHENGQLKLQNHYLKEELATADRARALSVFQARSPSKTVAARVIGNGTGANSKVVFVDRGSFSGVENGMAVVTPDGIVGKVVDTYPNASLVMLLTDPTFAAGVISEKNRVRGTLKGVGQTKCLVDYVQNEEKVDDGEWFYTSGDDRIFPRGFPVGQVTGARNGKTFKEIYLAPSGMQGGVEEVLIMLQGEHLHVPDGQASTRSYKILPAPTENSPETQQPKGPPAVLATDADRLRDQYKQSGEAQHHVFGEGLPGSKPPDFTGIAGVRSSSSSAAKPLQSAPPVAPPQRPAADTVTPAPATAAVPAKPKPKPTAPLLVTDPTDAVPSAETAAPPAPKPEKPSTGVKPAGSAPVKPPENR